MTEKDKTEKKPNRLVRWWRETKGELAKVTWPTPKEAWRMTKIVIAVMVVMGIVLFLFDLVFGRLIGWLVTL